MSLPRLAPLILLVAGCHDRIGGPGSALDRAASMTATSVVDQTGMVGALVASSPTVIVRDASGNPVAGVQVLFDGAFTQKVFTGSDGVATVPWTLPKKPGSYAIAAHAGNLASVRFSALAVVGPPAEIITTQATDRALLPGIVLAESVTVFVTDYVGNRLAGIAVTFETGGPPGATIERASTVTDEFGIASPGTWTLGIVTGVYTLTARAAGVLSSPTVSARVYEPFKVSTIAAGPAATCANSLSGVTYCWGFGSAFPTRIQGDARFVSLTVGVQFACGLTAEGAAFCWGRDVAGSISAQGSVITGLPRRIGTDLLFRRISAGGTLACGLSMDGRAYCWGENEYGQLGNGTTGASAVPKAVVGGHTFADLSAGYIHACGVTTSGEAYCWGSNDDRQLGAVSSETCDVVEYDYYNPNGPIVVHIPCSSVPLRVRAVPALAAVSAAQGSCGLGTEGEAFCWGRGNDVELVSSTVRFDSIAATQLLVARAAPLPSATASMCGTTTSGGVFCGSADVLVAVAPNLVFSMIVSGGNHACGVIRESGLAYCWGANSVGELGNGTLRTTTVPTPVSAP